MQITVKGVDYWLKRLEKYNNMDAKLLEIAKRLCDVGKPILDAGFGSHANVHPEPTKNGYVLVIDGTGEKNEIFFIEFGTGDSAGIHAKEYDEVPSFVRPKSWSETHAHMYETLGFWVWHGQWFRETPPHPYTFDAYKAMVESLPQIVNEVFQ